MLPWNNGRTIENMDGWNRCCQITGYLSIYTCLKPTMISPCYCSSCSKKIQQIWKNLWQQLLFYNRKRAIRRMDSCNWRRINIISLKTETSKKAYFKESPLKILDPCKWLPEIMAVPLRCMILCIPLKLKKYLSNTLHVHKSWPQVLFWNKYTIC